MNSEAFKDRLIGLGASDPDRAMARFDLYLKRLIAVNAVMNLTAITDPDEIIEKHFLDSLLIAPSIAHGAKLADVGSGAGFPGLPLAILRDDLKVTLIEPTTKRCTFLSELILELGLENVWVVNDRAENLPCMRETQDVVTARAVAALPILLELCVPLVKVDGLMIAMKGQKAPEELEEAKHALKTLHCTLVSADPVRLPSAGDRYNLIFKKTQTTDPKYPRAYAQIKKKPL